MAKECEKCGEKVAMEWRLNTKTNDMDEYYPRFCRTCRRKGR